MFVFFFEKTIRLVAEGDHRPSTYIVFFVDGQPESYH